MRQVAVIDLDRLIFLRWLVDRGRLDGEPSGPLAALRAAVERGRAG